MRQDEGMPGQRSAICLLGLNGDLESIEIRPSGFLEGSLQGSSCIFFARPASQFETLGPCLLSLFQISFGKSARQQIPAVQIESILVPVFGLVPLIQPLLRGSCQGLLQASLPAKPEGKNLQGRHAALLLLPFSQNSCRKTNSMRRTRPRGADVYCL